MSIHTQFATFHQKNPIVYIELVRLARNAKAKGHTKLGIGMLWEVMRWNLFFISSDPNSDFKLNNNYRSRYARLIMEHEQDLKDIFDIRELKTP